MSTYFAALIDIHDPERYARYLDGFDQVFQRYRGEVVAVEDSPRVLEGEWPAGRTVLIRFPDDEALLEWYRSPEYQALALHRRGASACNIAMLTGRD